MTQENRSLHLPSLENCRAVAIDLDGTLLDSRQQLSTRNRAAVQQCINEGLPILICTSRAERSVRQLIGDDLTAKCSLVMENGGVIRGAKPLSGSFREIIPGKVARNVVQLILNMEPSVRVGIELDGFEFGCNLVPDRATLWSANRATPDMVLPLDIAVVREVTKLWVNGLGKDLSNLARALSHNFGDSVAVFPNATYKFLDIPSVRTSKAIGAQYLLNSQRITLKETIALGDDTPDIVLLQACGVPVAVANATPEVLACTPFRTTSNDQDGVALVLEQILAILWK